jgi:hypothetical protein
LFFTLESQFADGELWRLQELFQILDKKLAEIDSRMEKSIDPGSDGLLDQGEYFIGLGFVAIQQYLVETITFTGLSKLDAYKLGPKHPSGATYIGLVNACANWWKHEPEWFDAGEVPMNGLKSFGPVTEVTDSPDYQLSNVLASFCDASEKVRFSCVIGHLKEWRSNVHESRKK